MGNKSPASLRRIFATRPRAQNAAWLSCLKSATSGHFQVEALPLLEIDGLSGAELAPAKAQILRLDEYTALIFVSQNAAQYGAALIDQYWPQRPVRQRWVAIGSATAACLQTCLDSDIPLVTAPAMTTESLLEQPDIQTLDGTDKVLILRGRGGRNALAEGLRMRGVQVEYCELYARALPLASVDLLRKSPPGAADVLPVFSGETLHNLVALGELAAIVLDMGLTLVVPGQRVAELAYSLGFERVSVADNASQEAMLDAIMALRLRP